MNVNHEKNAHTNIVSRLLISFATYLHTDLEKHPSQGGENRFISALSTPNL